MTRARAAEEAELDRLDVGKPHLLPDAIRAFDQVGFVELGPGPASGAPYHPVALELVRVPIPKDAVGVLTSLWQYVETPTGPLGGPLDVRRLGARVEVDWSLVLEDSAPQKPEMRRIEGPDPQPPSSRVPPYGSFDDLRFTWGSAAPIKVFAQERSILSLWVRVVSPVGEVRTVGGRLAGYTQHGKSPHTYENLTWGL